MSLGFGVLASLTLVLDGKGGTRGGGGIGDRERYVVRRRRHYVQQSRKWIEESSDLIQTIDVQVRNSRSRHEVARRTEAPSTASILISAELDLS